MFLFTSVGRLSLQFCFIVFHSIWVNKTDYIGFSKVSNLYQVTEQGGEKRIKGVKKKKKGGEKKTVNLL